MRIALASLAAAALVLTGCSSSPNEPSDSATPVVSESPSPSPTPTEASPAPSETASALDCPIWTDDPDFEATAIGPISFAGVCVGQSFDEARATTAPVETPEQCPWYGQIVQMEEPGLYVSALSDPTTPGERINFFILYWYANPEDAASYEMPTTPEGITIGSRVEDVLAAYPDATEVTFEDIARGTRTQIIVPTSATTTYNFDINAGTVTEISWGEGLSSGGPNGDLCAL